MEDLLSKSLVALTDGLASASSLLSSFSQNSHTTATTDEQRIAVPEFLQQLARIKSKHEERQYVLGHLDLLHATLPEEESKPGFVKDAIIKCICCHLLGYDVNFICIYAIKLAQCGTLLDKRIGYLAASLLLNSDHELSILLVNTIQRDLRSAQPLEIACALAAAGSLLSCDTIPAVLPLVCDRLRHSKAYVRKKAVACLRCFLAKSPVLEEELRGSLRTALLDKDPAVMWSTLHVYGDLIKKAPHVYADLVPSLVSILRQVIDGKLPKDFDHQNCPSPFLIVQLLKLLARLGSGNASASSKVYQLLVEIMERFQWQTSNAALAVASECCLTSCAIYPLDTLLALSSQYAGRLLSSCHGNTVYTGVKILAQVAVAQRLELVRPYQLTLVNLLEDSKDVNLRKQVLNLLYGITNPSNVELVFLKLLEHVKTAVASNADLIDKLFVIIERFSPSSPWFVSKLKLLLVECMIDEFAGAHSDRLLRRALVSINAVMENDAVWLQELLGELQLQLAALRSSDSSTDCFAVVASWAASRLYTAGVVAIKGCKSAQQLSATVVALARCSSSPTARLWLLCVAKLLLLHSVFAADGAYDGELRCTMPSDKQIFSSVAERQQLHELEMVQELSARLRVVASKILPALQMTSQVVVDVSFLPALPDPTDSTDHVASASILSSGNQKSSLCYTTYADSPRQAMHESATALRHSRKPPAVVRKIWSRAGRQVPSGNESEVADPDSVRKQQLAAELFSASRATSAKESAKPTG